MGNKEERIVAEEIIDFIQIKNLDKKTNARILSKAYNIALKMKKGTD